MDTIIQQKTKNKRYTVRSPTLQTVLMVEEFIKEHNSEFKKTELFEKLPRKVMWNTFQIIMTYLEDTYKIIIEKDGVITYIWNPKFFEKIKNRPEIKL
ncbi:hypothetical protein ES703_123042 [subsurface metagenome]